MEREILLENRQRLKEASRAGTIPPGKSPAASPKAAVQDARCQEGHKEGVLRLQTGTGGRAGSR